MSADHSSDAPPGPDLAAGIPSADLADGAMCLGHLGEDAVLLVRQGGAVHAIGAFCTHYHGPLAEGILTGEGVRCPWHHACFDLRTGQPVRTPALLPVPCYDVEERDGRVRVTGKRERPDVAPGLAPDDGLPAPAAPAAPPARVVIVGGGAAGAACADELRRQGHEGEVILLTADPDAPYDRPNLSKDYLAGNAPEEWIPLHPDDYWAERRVELRRGARVVRLDLDARVVLLDGGERVAYDALVLATGATPVRLDLESHGGPPIHYLRTLADSRAIVAHTQGARTAVVLGASFIGLEVAASLRARGLAVHVVAPDDRPLARVLGPELGALVQQAHEAHEVTFHLGHTATAVDEAGVHLDDGRVLGADLVVVGVGVRPDTALAESAGLAVDDGVLVDERLRTSAPHVWAAGDIARYPDARTGERVRIEHWVLAERHGQAVARDILGRGEPFTQAPFFWSAHYDTIVSYVGHARRFDRTVVDGDPMQRDATVRYERDGRTLAVATVGRQQATLEAEVAMERELRGVGR